MSAGITGEIVCAEMRIGMGYKILIADDEAEIRDVLHLYLEKDGYEVVEAADGVEAMEKIKKEQPDLAILDIMMPGLDGYRVLRNIRESNNIPVIMLSAKDSDADKILGLDLGADDYITKPFTVGSSGESEFQYPQILFAWRWRGQTEGSQGIIGAGFET